MWEITNLRTKLLYTALFLFLFRVGCALPVPFVRSEMISAMFDSGNLFSYLNMISGGALSQCAVFALGVSPYINASIVVQLLVVAIPALDSMKRDDPKKLQKVTSYVTLGFSFVMAIGYFAILRSYGALSYSTGFAGVLSAFAIIAMFMAGSQMVVWLGWQIDDYGIGNGISLIIFTGIISRWNTITYALEALVYYAQENGWFYVIFICLIPVLVLAGIYLVVKATNAEKRIPVQYAKTMRGNSTVGGGASYIPIKLVMSGVMPIIFASTMLSIPSTIAAFIDPAKHPSMYQALAGFNSGSWLYCVIYIALIFAFNYFYIEIQFDGVQIANNLRKNGGAIPGIRPGKSTSEYLTKAANSVALMGAIVLAIVAATPIILGNITGLAIQLGGTSLLIVCGVALEEMAVVNSFMTATNHKGFLL